jgi:hypothetical protein
MITVQLQLKDERLNGLAWLCSSSTHMQQHRCTTAARSTQQQIVHDNRTATIKDAQLTEWLAWFCFVDNKYAAHCCALQHAARSRLYMITIQPQSKMYSWKRMVGMAPLIQQRTARTAVVLLTQQIVYMIATATKQRCTAGMNGWHGSAHSAMHHAAAHCSTTARSRLYMITVQLQSKMHGWNEWLAWLCSFSMHTCSSALL